MKFVRFLSSRPSAPKALQNRKPVTINTIQKLYKSGTPITVLTAHDYPSSRQLDEAGINICLIGDSLAMTALGMQSTTEISLSEMIHHVKAVKRGNTYALMIGDMPFGSYESCPKEAVDNAIQFIRQGCAGVKMEGGLQVCETIKKVVGAGIPVMGHIGLTPQKINALV